MSTPVENDKLLTHTANIVSAHVSKNPMRPEDLPTLINSVYLALTNAASPEAIPDEILAPAVPIKKSVFSDYIVCLEDGKKMKMLKRHLDVSYGLTPDQYRARWNLPHDYPMVAPNYALTRSNLAKKIGLGRTGSSQPMITAVNTDIAEGATADANDTDATSQETVVVPIYALPKSGKTKSKAVSPS